MCPGRARGTDPRTVRVPRRGHSFPSSFPSDAQEPRRYFVPTFPRPARTGEVPAGDDRPPAPAGWSRGGGSATRSRYCPGDGPQPGAGVGRGFRGARSVARRGGAPPLEGGRRCSGRPLRGLPTPVSRRPRRPWSGVAAPRVVVLVGRATPSRDRRGRRKRSPAPFRPCGLSAAPPPVGESMLSRHPTVGGAVSGVRRLCTGRVAPHATTRSRLLVDFPGVERRGLSRAPCLTRCRYAVRILCLTEYPWSSHTEGEVLKR